MTIDQKVEMFRLRLEGNTLQEIADRFGITRERVRQILLSAESLRIRTPGLPDCIYPNLAKWLNENRYSCSGFAKKVGVCPSTIYKTLRGNDGLRKETIDKILKETGMSYEKAFYLPEREDEK